MMGFPGLPEFDRRCNATISMMQKNPGIFINPATSNCRCGQVVSIHPLGAKIYDEFLRAFSVHDSLMLFYQAFRSLTEIANLQCH